MKAWFIAKWAALVSLVLAVLAIWSARKASKHVALSDEYSRAAKKLDPISDIKKADALQKEARFHMAKAQKARQKAEKRIEKIGETDETLDDLIDKYNSRVRNLRKRA